MDGIIIAYCYAHQAEPRGKAAIRQSRAAREPPKEAGHPGASWHVWTGRASASLPPNGNREPTPDSWGRSAERRCGMNCSVSAPGCTAGRTPPAPIGARDDRRGESFIALNDVSFDMKPGERVGIIGRNGAGKSTLLKLISRVTAPTGGMIGLNGRVASMPEVGTGFHGELTGRENIYMNGAILGMTKRKSSRKWRTSSSFRHADPLGKRKWGHIILDNMTLLNSVFSDSSASEPLGPG